MLLLSALAAALLASAAGPSPAVNRLDLPTELLVLRDEALAADALGEERPQTAAAAWRRVAEYTGKNPLKRDAEERAARWAAFAAEKAKAEAARLADEERLRAILPLASVTPAQKRALVDQFRRRWGEAAAGPLEQLIPRSTAAPAPPR